ARLALPRVSGEDSQKVGSADTGMVESPAEQVAPPSLEFDAQRFAWANGETTAPTVAARIVLDSSSRHGFRPSTVEILAIELAHAQPSPMREVARTFVERNPSVRPPPSHSRSSHKPASATPDTQGGLFHFTHPTNSIAECGSWRDMNARLN